jgi:cobalamin biosynthesis Mg chelatase CobN
MAVTAPTAPVKPTPPVMPSVSQTTSGNDEAPSDAAAAVQAPNPDFVNAVRQVESISAALQGKGKSGEAASDAAPSSKAAAPAANDTKAVAAAKPSGLPAAATAGSDESGTAQQTGTTAAAPAKPTPKPTSISYMPFVGIIVIVAVVLTAMKFLKQEKKRTLQKTLEQGGLQRKTALDVEALPDEKIKQKKSHFEVRI